MNEATRLYHRIRAMVLRDINAALAGRNTAGGATATVVEGHSHDDRYPLESELDAHIAATGVSVHGLGSISTQSAAGVNITGGNIAGITDLAVADGGTGASTASGARTNLGLVIGTNVQAWDADLDAIAALAKTDGNIIVGNGSTWVAESGSTARTSLGLGTGDSPQFTAINLGHASDTTIARVSAGLISVEGVTVTLNTATQTLTNKTLTTPTIASFVNAQHNHSNAAGGGTIAHSVLIGIGANDHHNQSHVLASTSGLGADHTVSGLTARQVLRATSATTAAFGAIEDADIPSTIVRTSRTLTAGAGLTGGGDLTANRTFNVGAGAGITVNTADVALTTPGSVTVSSANSSSGNHTHAVVSSSNPGSAASLLATDGSGRLNLAVLGVGGLPGGSDKFNVAGHATLDSADFDGAVTIDDDLSVVYGGYYPLYVNVNTVTPSASNVGIMTNNPDAQFALDVAGPIRGEVLVGPHAIQLEDAEMIVHFDGPRPYETDFSGFSTGHMGQVGTESGGVIYRPGKFGKAVQVAEATTNLFTNPSFETGVTSWNVTGTATFVQSSDWFYYGSYSGRFQSTNVQRIETDVTANTSAGTQYTYTCFVRGSGTVYLRFFDNVSGNQAGSNIALSDDWQRVVLTKTFGAGSTSRYVHIVSTGAIDCYVDAVQLEQKSYATPYCDGSLGSGHSWSGTAHASTSSRTSSYVTYAAARWDKNWSIGFWTQPTAGSGISTDSGQTARLLQIGTYNTDPSLTIMKWYNDDNKVTCYFRDSTANGTWTATLKASITYSAMDWLYIAVTHNKTTGTLTLYVYNETTGTTTAATATGSTVDGWGTGTYALGVGGVTTYSSGGPKALIDDLSIVNAVWTANEIRAIYESEAQVFAYSSTFAFRSPSRSAFWVDEEGAWFRSYSGNVAFGIYGGQASKSWGGLTLYDSDLAIGNSTAGYIHWHSGVDVDDATYYGNPLLEVAGRMHVKNNSTFDGTISIGTSGGIYQGTGTFASPTTGLKIWNDSGVGRIAGYNAGTAQWYANTDGKLYAGAGAVTLDANGITISSGSSEVNLVSWKTGGNSTGYAFSDRVSTSNRARFNAINVTSTGSVVLQATTKDNGDSWIELIEEAVSNNFKGVFIGKVGGEPTAMLDVYGTGKFSSDLTLPNTGLHLLDTNASHDLIIAPGSNLTADRTLTITTGDADRTLTLTGNATMNQDVSTAGSPAFAGLTVDTSTLYVDAVNNRVGVNASSFVSPFQIGNGTSVDIGNQPGGLSDNFGTVTTTTANETVSWNLSVVDGSRNTRAKFFLTDGAGATGAWGLWYSWSSSGSQPFVIGGANSEFLRLDTSGKMGLGTGLPESPLHVQTTSTSVTNFLILEGDRNTGNTEVGILFVDRNSVSGGQRAGRIWTDRIAATGNFDLVFQAGDEGLAGLQNESMRIHGDTGNVLIGTSTNSGYLLDVNGTARVGGTTRLSGNVGIGDNPGSWALKVNGDASVVRIGVGTDPNASYRIDAAGNIKVGGDIWSTGNLDVDGEIVVDGYVGKGRTFNQSVAASGTWNTGITISDPSQWLVNVMVSTASGSGLVESATWLVTRMGSTKWAQLTGGLEAHHTVVVDAGYEIDIQNDTAGTRYISAAFLRIL